MFLTCDASKEAEWISGSARIPRQAAMGKFENGAIRKAIVRERNSSRQARRAGSKQGSNSNEGRRVRQSASRVCSGVSCANMSLLGVLRSGPVPF